MHSLLTTQGLLLSLPVEIKNSYGAEAAAVLLIHFIIQRKDYDLNPSLLFRSGLFRAFMETLIANGRYKSNEVKNYIC
ncbi:MAG TPA: hypothetical protein DEF45_14505 [Rhodopirellula sp.]|nr:hypothetical protein [Rhodopirellula sp.]